MVLLVVVLVVVRDELVEVVRVDVVRVLVDEVEVSVVDVIDEVDIVDSVEVLDSVSVNDEVEVIEVAVALSRRLIARMYCEVMEDVLPEEAIEHPGSLPSKLVQVPFLQTTVSDEEENPDAHSVLQICPLKALLQVDSEL